MYVELKEDLKEYMASNDLPNIVVTASRCSSWSGETISIGARFATKEQGDKLSSKKYFAQDTEVGKVYFQRDYLDLKGTVRFDMHKFLWKTTVRPVGITPKGGAGYIKYGVNTFVKKV